jgi:Ca-activated chloride channel family protein
MISALGGTEIFQGLSAGIKQIRRNFSPRMVNHIILLTDGHTFGDQDQCIALAEEAGKEGIGISAMGLGHDWNDEFLDTIASMTGGNSVYINSAAQVVRFLENQVRSLVNAFAERVSLSIAPETNIQLESAFKLSPHPQPLAVEGGHLILGSLQLDRHISVLLQLQMPSDLSEGPQHLARLVVEGDILTNQQSHFVAVEDIQVEISETTSGEYPPAAILDALSKLTLYRLQERANEALEGGDVAEATRRLENLATRLLAMGQEQLAGQALAEARRVAHTSDLSSKGRKTLKYQTRYLLTNPINEDEAP